MKIICVVKFVPDVDSFNYDFENNTLVRENTRLTLNPDDACAIAYALKIKEIQPDTVIEVVTMAPSTIMPHMEDLIRMGVNHGVILSDKVFAGSDTYATSFVIAKYLKMQTYDAILTGTHALDGDTSHIPPQIAQRLAMTQLSNIIHIDLDSWSDKSCQVVVDNELMTMTYKIQLPAILSLTRESSYKLPYVKRADMNRDVRPFISILNHDDLGLEEQKVGMKGSLTKVMRTYTKTFDTKDKNIVSVDEAGIETVFDFLKDKGILK